jgi:hypothetical protein
MKRSLEDVCCPSPTARQLSEVHLPSRLKLRENVKSLGYVQSIHAYLPSSDGIQAPLSYARKDCLFAVQVRPIIPMCAPIAALTTNDIVRPSRAGWVLRSTATFRLVGGSKYQMTQAAF